MKQIHYKIKKYIRPYKLNIYLALLFRLLMIMVFMQQGRILFYLFNQELFPKTDLFALLSLMQAGFLFDLTAVLYINSLYIFLQIVPLRITSNTIYQTICKYIFIVTNSVAIVTNMIDVVYYRVTMQRSTISALHKLSNEKNLVSVVWRFFLSHWYMFIISGMVITGVVVTYKLISVRPLLIRKKQFYYPVAIGIMALCVMLFFAGIRGGFADATPIKMSEATEYIDNPGEESIVLNTPFSIIRTFEDDSFSETTILGNEEIENPSTEGGK